MTDPRARGCLSGVLLACLVASQALAQHDPYRPPLYWSVYEYHIVLEDVYGVREHGENYIPESELAANIDWVEANLKDFGYDMIAIDGWGDQSKLSEHGYQASHSQHWEHDFAWWSAQLRARGMRLGMYGNPLWIHVDSSDTTTKIVSTDLNVSSLIDPEEESAFTWVQIDRPGAEEYVKGHIKYYADMGIDYFRVDYLSWYEDGHDRYLGRTGPERPREHYETALRWMREAADQYGVYLSLVMPHLYNEAELERLYGHMFRINEDTGAAEWFKFSEKDRGHRFDEWSQYANALDGFAYWSYLSDRNLVRLDGDFIRINTFTTDNEKRTVISGHLVAGGPIAVADQYNTIDDAVWVYQNEELLALNADGFVGQPLSHDPTNEASQIWTGRMSTGEAIVAFFNREDAPRTRSLSFADLGFTGTVAVRDLWQRADLGSIGSISVDLPPHGSMVIKLADAPSTCQPQSITFAELQDRAYGDPPTALSATASSGLPVEFEVALGPATLERDQLHLTGQSGVVYVLAKQAGDGVSCAAIPQLQSFEVTGGIHEADMYFAGTFTNWKLVRMRLQGEEWVAEQVPIPAGAHEMKFANTGDWSGTDWGNAEDISGIAQETTGGRPNIRFGISEPGLYTISFNDVTLEYELAATDACLEQEGGRIECAG